MLKHIVFWKFKDEAEGRSKEENMELIREGLMGLVAALIMTRAHGKKAWGFILRLIASVSAELIMVAGYFVFEALYYDIAAAAGSVVFNLIQAGAAIVLAIPLTYAIRVKKAG